MTDALRQRGAEHERAYVESLRTQELQIVEIDQNHVNRRSCCANTRGDATRGEVIVQAALEGDSWLGYADILQRVPRQSALGDWSYEPYDTKLARETRGGTILQLSVYADLLDGIQQRLPERFWVVTPGDADAPFVVTPYRYADFAAYVRVVRAQLSTTLALGHDAIQKAHYPEPVEQCDVCRWEDRCNKRRRKDDHLSFIAGIGRVHREELTAQGFPTLATAAAMPLPIAFKPSRGSRDTYTRIREQARVQHRAADDRAAGPRAAAAGREGRAWPGLPEPVARGRVPGSGGRAVRARRRPRVPVRAVGCSPRTRPLHRGSTTVCVGLRTTPRSARRSRPSSTAIMRALGRAIPACTSITSATTSRPRSSG